MERGKALQLVERAFFLEHRGIAFQRKGRVEYPGAAAGGFLCALTACGALSVPRKNLGDPDVAALRSASRCVFALGNRQAIGVRPDPADEHGVAVDVQVLRRDRCRDVGPAARHEGDCFSRGDMLKHHLQPGKSRTSGDQVRGR